MERWKGIPGAPGYQASDHGRIRSIDRTIRKSNGRTERRLGKLLKPFPNEKGYLRVNVGGKFRYVHDLILEAWVGPRPPGRIHGCHADDNKINNTLNNLSWKTAVANEQAKVQHGRHRNGTGQTAGATSQRTDYHREYRRRNGELIRARERARDRYNRTHKHA
ncbi:MAG TPA: NUMOD4 domain-containing protein [Mycobacterium sp.]|jgi:hypothetical protein|nr:NUMOD4 domain-containing protein [Mycobacterium sp.]